jgi:Mn2+/Fe2+ NRAMP family transporter
MLLAAHKKSIIGNYRHPHLLTIFGILVVIMMAAMGGYTLIIQLSGLINR